MQHHTTLLFVYLRLANLALPRDEVNRFLLRIEQSLAAKEPGELTPSERDVLDEVRQIGQRLARGPKPARGRGVPHLPPGKIPDPRWKLLDALLVLSLIHI